MEAARTHTKQECLIYTKHFPHSTKERKKRYEVILGIGGNDKHSLHCFEALFCAIQKNHHIDILSTSPFYYNPPFGFLEQEWFYNAVMRISTNLGYKELFAYTSYLERRFGRERKRPFKNAPRTLDIDIIAFDNLCIHTSSLTIPHRAWQERESVIIPLLLDIHKGEL